MKHTLNHLLMFKKLKLRTKLGLFIVITFILQGNVIAQYWGNQMMETYSESLLNGQISVIKSSKIVSADNDLLLFSDGYGFHIYNISNPSSPV